MVLRQLISLFWMEYLGLLGFFLTLFLSREYFIDNRIIDRFMRVL
ncbi:hypothetical protein S1OALGB6SA_1099 [Olavius algarvensis spirochete endosymbiont]|nr:hypothetical protein S1OALGB6SA_1099 [Olavius algarvensis spirochete endosymbiont]